MITIESTLRHALEVSGGDLILTLDPALQGLPETAHGGSVLAVFDALAGVTTPREVCGIYRRRVPLGLPLTLLRTREDSIETFVLSDQAGSVLVDGRVAPLAAADADDTAPKGPGGDGAGSRQPVLSGLTPRHVEGSISRDMASVVDERTYPLPISRACFACGTDNELGLRATLGFDADAVRGTWQPRAPFRRADGSLEPAALTTLLDEAAFWLGVLATGESGMTTELRVSLHGPAPFEAPVTVTGARGSVRPRNDDPRYQETEIVARAGGQVVATAHITFVVVRGAARRLVSGMLAINDPECVRRVFPDYTR
jgi:acyl-coenzyme A thioesterase PaaI-like protein